jgi:hypothetical protein
MPNKKYSLTFGISWVVNYKYNTPICITYIIPLAHFDGSGTSGSCLTLAALWFDILSGWRPLSFTYLTTDPCACTEHSQTARQRVTTVLLNKLLVTYLVKKFPAFNLIAGSLPCSQQLAAVPWPAWNEPTPSYQSCWWKLLILCRHRSLSLPSGSPLALYMPAHHLYSCRPNDALNSS